MAAAAETGGRLSREAKDLLTAAAAHRASVEAPPALPSTLNDEGTGLLLGTDGVAPSTTELWQDEPTLVPGSVEAGSRGERGGGG